MSHVMWGRADRGEGVKECRGDCWDWGSQADSVVRVDRDSGGESESGGGDGGRGEAECERGGGEELSLLPLPPHHLPPLSALLLPGPLPVDHLATIPPHPDHVREASAWEGFVSLCEGGQAGQAEDGG